MNTEKRENNNSDGEPVVAGLTGRIDGWLQKAEGWTIFGLLVLLVVLTFVQVVLRNLPGNPSAPWIDLGSRLVVLWVGLLGASLAVARGKHISIDVASRLLPPGPMKWARGITGAMSLVVILALVHASLAFTIAKHKAATLPLFTIEALGLSFQEYFFTDFVPVIFFVMLWHTWVKWRGGLGEGRKQQILGIVAGVAVVVSLLLIVAADFSWWIPAEGNVAESTLGAVVLGWPLVFLLLSIGLALMGAPLYVVIAAIALIGHYALEDIPVQNFIADGYGGFRKSTIFLAIPLFTLAGYLMAEGNTPKRLVGLFRGFLGWMPGGVAIVALIACSFFTAFTGASGVTIIALGGLLLPILLADNYPEKFSLGLLTTGGSRGLIFPPAIPVFLLAMIMGLYWDAVTATGPFGSAVMDRAARTELCRQRVTELEEELALDRELSADDDDEALDRLLDQRLGVKPEKPAEEEDGRDEFEMGDDETFDDGSAEAPEEERDEFELGDDETIEIPEPAPAAEEERDEFELGDDETIEVAEPAPVADEERDEFELGDDESISDQPTAVSAQPGAAEVSSEAGETKPESAEQGAEAADPESEAGGEATISVPSSKQIFAAGLIPGLLMVLAIAVYCVIVGLGGGVVRTRFTLGGARRALWSARFELPIPIIIGVGIFGGFFTPAEAASATAAYTLLMQLVLYRDFGLRRLKNAFVDSMVLVGGILIILIAAMGLLNFLVVAKVPDLVLTAIENFVPERLEVLGLFTLPRKVIFLLMLNVFLLVVGCLMDIFSAILVVLPLLLPISYRFGIHPAHLAVIFLTNLEIGYSTPPVGINLFVASLRFDKPVVKLYAASIAFLGIMLGGLMLITYWPDLSLWLVNVTGIQ